MRDRAAVRVAIVTESFLPVVNGVTNSVRHVLAHLRRSGHDALVVAPGPGPDEHEGVPVVRVPAIGLPALPIGVPTRRVHATLRDFGPDVVHLASPFVVGASGLAAARRLDVPTVAVYQTDVAGFAGAYGLGGTAGAAWRWIRRLHAAAGRTLAPSTAAVEALTRHGVPRVHRWGRGVDTALFTPSRRDERLRAELGGGTLVGYVGRLAREKDVHRLAALRGLDGVRLVVVGDGPARAALRRLLPDAAFLGFLAGPELARAYASLDVFVHPGRHETFCQTVQEALASGVPVVAADEGGPRDLVARGRTGFLVGAGDDATWRAAVATLTDDAVRVPFAAAARRSVLRRTWPAVCDELLGHYRAVTGATPGPTFAGTASHAS